MTLLHETGGNGPAHAADTRNADAHTALLPLLRFTSCAPVLAHNSGGAHCRATQTAIGRSRPPARRLNLRFPRAAHSVCHHAQPPVRRWRGREDRVRVVSGARPQAEPSHAAGPSSRSEVRDGMRIDWDVAVAMDDGAVVRCDVFRPINDGRYPAILSYGPYAKGLAFQDGYPSAWERMAVEHPDVTAGSSNAYQSWEVVDPEKWVPHEYACVRFDARGCGTSAGFIDHFSPRETRDLYECIEWSA